MAGVAAGPRAAPWREWGVAPARVETPEDATALAALLAECARRGTAVLPVGAGTALAAGGPPAPVEVAIRLERLSGIVEFAPGDLTLTVKAGTPLAELSPVLAAAGQWLPGAPAGDGTVGGLVASGHTDPEAREAHGTLRERVLGMQVASAEGVLTRSGGRVVKNVAGYDLHRMHPGAGGALGLVTEVCFRLEPLPERRAAVAVTVAGVEAAREAWRTLRRGGPEPACVELRPGAAGGWRLRALLAGDAETVEDMAAGLARAWEARAPVEREEEPRPPGPPARGPGARRLELSLRTSPSRSFDALARLEPLVAGAGGGRLTCYPSWGEVHLLLEGEDAALAAAWEHAGRSARAGEAHYQVADAPADLAPGVPAWSAHPSALRLLARLKRAHDPAGILRPGSWSAERLEAAAAWLEGGEAGG